MIRALTTAATGLEAQQANIARISSDIANVNTDAYKKSEVEFQDLMYQTLKEPGAILGEASQSPVGIQAGTGVRVGSSYKNFEQGSAKITNNQLDMMIEGNGFFPITMPNGEIQFTRNGSFHVDAQGIVQLSNGGKLIPQVTVPRNATSVVINRSGEIKAQIPGATDTTIGQIQLVNFINPSGLIAGGNGMYKPTLASGEPAQSIPGENGVGSVAQGAVESSNVNVANSMVDMIQTQRAYEMNTKVMGIANEMMGATVNAIK
jgi:flagellar basal-body rod protein FlgG